MSGRVAVMVERWGWVVVAAVALATFAAAVGHGFVYWDDHREIFENPYLRPPTWSGLWRFWRESYYGLYTPLSYSVQWMIAHVARGTDGKLEPAWYHAISVVAHASAAIGVWGVVRKVVGGGAAAVIGAAAFAVHPVQAEAVNWASSFYTVFSGALGMGALWLYLEYRDRLTGGGHAWRWAVAATGVYALAVCAKPSLVCLPVVAGAIEVLLRGARVRDVAGLLGVWVAMGVPMSLVTVDVQEGQYRAQVPAWERPLIAADSVGCYLRKVVWPWPMGADYGRSPEHLRETGEVWWTWVVPAAVVAAAWLGRRKVPWGLGALAVFAGGALPFLGLMTFGFQRYSTVADRYIYVGMLGLAIAVAATVKRWPRAGVVAVAACAVWAGGSLAQSRYWQGTRPLMEHALAVNPTSRVGHNVLAYLATEEGDDEEAVRLYRETLKTFPAEGLANYNLGNRALARGRLDEAIAYYEAALPERGHDPQLHTNLGVALARSARVDAAEREFRNATELAPDWAAGWGNLAALLAAEGRTEDARGAYGRALQADPNYAAARAGLAKLNAAR